VLSKACLPHLVEDPQGGRGVGAATAETGRDRQALVKTNLDARGVTVSLAAKAGGLYAIGVSWGRIHSAEKLVDADVVIHRAPELLDLV